MIPEVRLKNSNVAISRLGFGSARLFAGRELQASAKLLEVALGAGIRHFDTAPSYGGGTSEGVLGQILGGCNDITIATKVGLPHSIVVAPFVSGQIYRKLVRPALTYVPGIKRSLLKLASKHRNESRHGEAAAQKRVLSRDEILYSLEKSLERLMRPKIDLYLIHEPDQFVLNQELFQVFEDLKKEGVIGAYGLGYGRYVKKTVWPGAVIQGEFNPDYVECFRHETLIFHGLIRKAVSRVGDAKIKVTPGERIKRIMQLHPECAVIFSASTGRQIRHIVKDIFEENMDVKSEVQV